MNTYNNVFFNDESHIVCVTNYLSQQFNIISDTTFISIRNNFFIDICHNLYVYNHETMTVQKIENFKAEKILNHDFVMSTDNKYYKINYNQHILINTDLTDIIEIYDCDTGYIFVTIYGDIYRDDNIIISGVNTFSFYKNILFYIDTECNKLIRINLIDNHRYIYKSINLGNDCVLLLPCIFDHTNNNIYLIDKINGIELLKVNIYNNDGSKNVPYFKSVIASDSYYASIHDSYYALTESGKIYKLYSHLHVLIEKDNLGIYKSIYNLAHQIQTSLNNNYIKWITMITAVGINEQNNLTVIEDNKLIISNVHEQISNHILKNARSNQFIIKK